MTKPEYSGVRDLTYSSWHRTISPKCYCLNMDWIVYRYIQNELKVVACIEEKDDRANVQKWLDSSNGKAFLLVANALNVPAYLVSHNCIRVKDKNEWVFKALDLRTNVSREMKEEEYKKFIENLGGICGG